LGEIVKMCLTEKPEGLDFAIVDVAEVALAIVAVEVAVMVLVA
jgi:hypothetical protein